MEHLESMLKRNWLSDPEQLIPLLKDLSGDEHIPLIARNRRAFVEEAQEVASGQDLTSPEQ
jgi:hypothetical protein